ncbi:MAG TPA: ArsR family transcriptional regulator [Ktedonobacterales bacterium]
MSSTPWYQRILTSTRGRLISLLRRDTHTVDELAQALDLTDNAVRAHLATLERDGLVQQQGVRRTGGSGKPAYAYALTEDAERLFPKAYGPVLHMLLDVLDEQMAREDIERVLREVGHRLAAEQQKSSGMAAVNGDLTRRLVLAVDLLNALGGLAEIEEQDGSLVIRGYSCPLAAMLPGHPEACKLAESLVTEVAGVPLHECCERGEVTRCCFATSHT